jgi:hypothetical protein
VREPRWSGEREHAPLSLGCAARELVERVRDVAADDDEAVGRVDEDAWCPGVWPGVGSSRMPGSTSVSPSCST